jgi:hypothetical protein
LTVITVTYGSLLVPLRAKLEAYRLSNGHHFTLLKVADDASCLFRSFALLLKDKETEHAKLKEA